MKPNLEAFRMLAEVGSGAHGTVHRAITLTRVFDLEEGSEVAVKFLRRELIEDEAFQRRFRREAEIGMEVRHENVVRFHGLLDGSLFGLPYLALVMDFVHGRTLRALLDSQGPPLEALVLRVGRDAASGLAALHQKNIVHRDIKPENLYLADDGSTKIVDLGYADVIARGRRSSLAGTLAYAAPELLRGAAATPQSDLYALALTLFELAAGRLPFDEASDVDALLDERLHSAPRRLSALRPRTSPFFDTLLDEMLRIDAERRPFDARDFARVLEGGTESAWWRLRRRTEPVLASKQRVRATRRPAPTRLFGRDREVARLDELYREVRLGRPRVVVLRGAEGVGKRRLVDDFVLRHLDDRDGAVYFAGEASVPGSGRPLSPFGWFLMKAFDVDFDDDEDEARRRRAVTRLSFRLQHEGGIDEESATTIAGALFDLEGAARMPIESTAAVFRSLASRERPLILRVHRAERLTHRALRLVHELAAGSGAIFVLFCVHDGDEVDASLAGHETLRLGPLDAASAKAFVTTLFEDKKPGVEAAVTSVLHQVEALPGLVLDALEVARARGDVQGLPGRYHSLAPNAQFPIAGQLEHYLSALFEAEDEATRALLEAAAILGPRFRVDDLAAVTGQEELSLLEQLSALRERWFLGGDGQLRFRRRSQRRFVLERCDPERRKRLQDIVAERFEARGARPLKRAIHWARAGNADKAVPLLLDGAERALQRRELAATELLVVRAQQQLDRAPKIPVHLTARLRAYALEAELDLVRGRPDKADDWIRRGQALAHAAREAPLRARLQVLAARAARARGFRQDAMRLLDAVLPSLDANDAATFDARLDHVSLLDENGALRQAWREARDIAREVEERHELDAGIRARSALVLGTLEAKRLHVDRAEELFEEAASRLERRDEGRRLVEVHLRRAELALELGNERRLERELRRADAIFERDRNLVSLLPQRARRAYIEALFELAASRPSDALPLLDDAARDAEASGDSFGGVAVQVARLEARIALQSATEEEATTLLRTTARAGDPRLFMVGCALAAEFHRRNDDPTRADAKLVLAFDELGKRSVEPTFPLRLLLTKSRVQRDLGASDAARRTRRLAMRRLERLSLRLHRAERGAFLRANPVRRALIAAR